VPTLVKGDVCERVFRDRSRGHECKRGKHSALCLDFPTRTLSRAEYEAAYAASSSPKVRIQIIANRIFVVFDPAKPLASKYPQILLRHLRHIAGAASLHMLPDVDFILNVADGSPGWPYLAHNNAPWFRGRNRTWHVPTDTGVGFVTKPPDGRACEAPSEAERRAWAAKDPRLVFRGSATGFPVNTLRWAENMRARVSALSLLFPDQIDSRLTQMWTKDEETELLRNFISIGHGMSMSEIVNYKYVVHCDGHSQANRLAALMHSGSIVLLSTRYEVELTATVPLLPHVFPIQPDQSDLLQTLDCLRAHPDLALRRLRLGLERSRELVTYKHAVLHYWADLLEAYAALQLFNVTKHRHAQEASAHRFVVKGHVLTAREKSPLVHPYNRTKLHAD
jgi:hypothetical protein